MIKPAMSEVIPSQEPARDKESQVVEELVSHSQMKSDRLIFYTSWQISDFLNENSDKIICEPFPSSVHVVHFLSEADTELWLLQLCNSYDWKETNEEGILETTMIST